MNVVKLRAYGSCNTHSPNIVIVCAWVQYFVYNTLNAHAYVYPNKGAYIYTKFYPSMSLLSILSSFLHGLYCSIYY